MPKCGVKSNTTKIRMITKLESLVSRMKRLISLSSISNAQDKESKMPRSFLMLDLMTSEPSSMVLLILRTNLLVFVTLMFSFRTIILPPTKTVSVNRLIIMRPVKILNSLRAEIVIFLYRFVIPSFV